MSPSFFHHLHPPTIPRPQARFRHTLGAGGLAAFLAVLLVITGLLEMFYYVPTTEGAAESIQLLTFLVPFGGLVRNIHYWAAQLLLVVAVVHMVRVLFTGGYVKPRRFNYLLGLGLLVLVIFLNFSGYVLRWDEGVRWAMVAGTNLVKAIPGIGPGAYRVMMGGDAPGPATLIRFYAWHIFGLMVPFLFLAGWHIFRVRRDGGIAAPPPKERECRTRISRDELVGVEVVAMLVATAVLIIISLIFPAPIGPAMSQTASSATEARAPWFFLWVQELLKNGSAFLWGVLIPVLVLVVLAALPYLRPTVAPAEIGSWLPRSGRMVQVVTAVIILTLLVLTIL
ncbi:MAG: cytochrome b N-terminal domain-containing protein [Ardenticatenaceae bacterium]|nr:cytochrome b N-terminal domain-containing protein [Ardenticatenaceae bacterium]MCB9442767.1 cytochrome b N-terminal domain-containing protein [Ardenticatenaceae bacterium]